MQQMAGQAPAGTTRSIDGNQYVMGAQGEWVSNTNTQGNTGLPSGLRVNQVAPSAPVAANGQRLPAVNQRPIQAMGEDVLRDSRTAEVIGPVNDPTRPPPMTTEDYARNYAQIMGIGKPIPTTEQISQQTLTPYTGPAYDLNNSPLFQWQKKIADEGLTAQLAASGLSDSTSAQRELSRQNQAITAAERERVVGNLQSLTSLGMSGSSLGQAQFTTPQTGGVSDIYGNAAQQLAAFQGNMGAIQGQLASQQAQNAMAAYNAQAKQPSGIQTALELASSYGWLGGNKTTQPAIPSAMSNPYVNSAMTNANPFRLF
jgi:hypothetical protein